MLQYTELAEIPFIGQIVHYYPDKHTRLAALVIEVHKITREDSQELVRPPINLKVWQPDGKVVTVLHVFSFQEETFVERWSFINEIATLQKKDDEDLDDENILGTNSNSHVGIIN